MSDDVKAENLFHRRKARHSMDDISPGHEELQYIPEQCHLGIESAKREAETRRSARRTQDIAGYHVGDELHNGRERRSCRDAQASPAKSLSRPFRIPVHISSRKAHLRETADRDQGRNQTLLRLFRLASRPSHIAPIQSVAMQRSRNGHSMG